MYCPLPSKLLSQFLRLSHLVPLDNPQHHKPNRTTRDTQFMHSKQSNPNLARQRPPTQSKLGKCSILHRPPMCWRCSFWHTLHTLHSLVQETGNRKPRIFFTQNNLIHLSPTLNILSQKAQPFGWSNHCGPPKWSLVHHHMSAHICRLHNSWWQDLINSSSLRTLPRDLFCAFERFSWHSWQTACWHSPLFARKHMNTQ